MKASFENVDVAGKRVLVREDFNLPLKDGKIQDDTRIRAAQPTLESLQRRGGRTIVMSHLGRPDGKRDPRLSLRPVAEQLGCRFVPDCVGEAARNAVGKLADGEVLLLENVRFHREEEENDPEFARKLASLGQLYVNDAFAASHRAHASVVYVARYLPAYAGHLMLAELRALHQALDKPKRPLIAIVGGAKVSTKAGVLRHLLPRVEVLIVGGAMANTFLKARGSEVGASLVEDAALEEARRVAKEAGEKLLLPVDAVCVRKPEAGQQTRVMDVDAVEPGWMIVDIGPDSVAVFSEEVAGAGTVVWNGPVGIAEIREFSLGTLRLGEAIAASGAYSLVGGGDTAAAVEALGLGGRFSHVSTGGGATLEYLEGKELPGVAVLREE